MTDMTRLPTAADSATFVEAYRDWQRDADDAKLAAAMFRLFPGEGPPDERCVTTDGFAFVATREVYQDDSVDYDLEHYVLDAHVVVTR